MTTTTTMTATERTAKAVETKKARLEATKDRMVKATLVRQKAEAAVKAANARLEKAVAKLAKTKADADTLIGKQEADVVKAVEAHTKAKASEEAKAAKAKAQADREDARLVKATVETESGKTYDLTEAAVESIKHHVGRKKSGVFAPIDGAEAVAILEAIENKNYDLGDTFIVTIKGRKTHILFHIDSDGLRFETETAN
jgi:colicin import membrane protein